jgi:1,4-dihydroxy-2-naphthoate octaprenyltransferase
MKISTAITTAYAMLLGSAYVFPVSPVLLAIHAIPTCTVLTAIHIANHQQHAREAERVRRSENVRVIAVMRLPTVATARIISLGMSA